MSAIIEKLENLLEQATKERSHYYVAGCCREAITYIKLAEAQRDLATSRIDRANKALIDVLRWCDDREKMGMDDPELRSFVIGLKHLARDGIT